jgi:hypothetical protein
MMRVLRPWVVVRPRSGKVPDISAPPARRAARLNIIEAVSVE